MNAPIAPQQITSNYNDATDSAEPSNPFDSIFARLDSYIADPAQVTPKTLADLKAELEAVRADVEGDGSDAPAGPPPPAGAQPDTLASKIQAVGGR